MFVLVMSFVGFSYFIPQQGVLGRSRYCRVFGIFGMHIGHVFLPFTTVCRI